MFPTFEIVEYKTHMDWFPVSTVNVKSGFIVLEALYVSKAEIKFDLECLER